MLPGKSRIELKDATKLTVSVLFPTCKSRIELKEVISDKHIDIVAAVNLG